MKNVIDLVREMSNCGYSCVEYVSAANYQSRTTEAIRKLFDKKDDLVIEAKKLEESNRGVKLCLERFNSDYKKLLETKLGSENKKSLEIWFGSVSEQAEKLLKETGDNGEV